MEAPLTLWSVEHVRASCPWGGQCIVTNCSPLQLLTAVLTRLQVQPRLDASSGLAGRAANGIGDCGIRGTVIGGNGLVLPSPPSHSRNDQPTPADGVSPTSQPGGCMSERVYPQSLASLQTDTPLGVRGDV